MKKYKYSGKNKAGDITRGMIEAISRDDAAALLSQNDIIPLVISEDKNLFNKFKNINLFERVSLSDRLMFCEEISALINSGVPLAQSINIIKEQSTGTMKKVAGSILKEIEGGQSLSGALERQGKHFSPVFINMIKSGEAGGTLDKALENLAIQTQKDHELVTKIKGALIYPVMIILAMIGAVIFLMINVVPSVTGLFEDLEIDLPLTTKMLIAGSNLVVNYGIYLAVASVIVVVGFYLALTRIDSVKRNFHKLILKSPIIGKVSLEFNMARFARTLGSLLGSGVAVLDALDIVSHSSRNVIFIEEIKKITEQVKNGSTLASPIKKSKVFPFMTSQMISIGEETGNLDEMLMKVAEFYERKIDNFTKNISHIIEPIVMLIVGVSIGFIVVSIITPIYQMTSSMK